MTIGEKANFSTISTGSSAWDSVVSVIPAQLASVLWSDRLGLNVDDPFVGQYIDARGFRCTTSPH